MKRTLYVFVIVTAVSLTALAGSGPGRKEPNRLANEDLISIVEGPNVPYSNYISGDAFNLGFAELLKTYVNDNGLVNYPKLRRMRLELNSAANKLRDLKPEIYMTWSKNDKIAFWINAYNICTLSGIVEHYPIKPSRFKLLFYPANSIMHISGLRDKTYFDIMGLQYTLNEIERDILLGRFEEAGSCFAISNGTISGATLRNEPYVGKLIEKQLNSQTKAFFAKEKAFEIDTTNSTVKLTAILKMYKWREESFVKLYGSKKMFREYDRPSRAFLNFVTKYISAANADLLKRKVYSIEYIKYNWALNEAPDK
ncbi:MAG: DUF547 domain-containing protein [Anaerohalosphaeraceae bacterium]|nr:DUF547 domain-containing protein [Anaerohalosphaeraceae bacterium]